MPAFPVRDLRTTNIQKHNNIALDPLSNDPLNPNNPYTHKEIPNKASYVNN